MTNWLIDLIEAIAVYAVILQLLFEGLFEVWQQLFEVWQQLHTTLPHVVALNHALHQIRSATMQ